MDAPLHEVVGSLHDVNRETRRDTTSPINTVRAIASFFHDPNAVDRKAASKILEYLKATAHLGLTFSRG